MSPWLSLSRPALLRLSEALKTGRLSVPYSIATLQQYVPEGLYREVIQELDRLNQQGMTSVHLAYTLDLLAAERESSQQLHDQVELVWTGVAGIGYQSRETWAVVRELFRSAKSSVWIVSFAIDRGEKARQLFQPLLERMEQIPDLQVRMVLNVPRPYQSDEPTSSLLRQFAQTFRTQIWTSGRLPEVFYDPRSLGVGVKMKSCFHAKCVVVDGEQALITSANFTEAAHERNIEVGVLLNNPETTKAMQVQFETLVSQKFLRRLPGLSESP